MINQYKLECWECGTQHDADMSKLQCESCSQPLIVRYLNTNNHKIIPATIDSYSMQMPFQKPDQKITLGEGLTPVIQLNKLAKDLCLKNIDAKLEYMNPTGSYKDRGVASMITMAKEFNISELVEDSSGNAGASVSAYSAAANIKAHIFAPETAPTAKIRQIKVYGSTVHSIKGARDHTTAKAIEFQKQNHLVYLSHSLSPFFLEGTKSFAMEVALAYPQNLPEHIIFPVGNGGLYLGAWIGFNELKANGLIDKIPRLHAVQSSQVMPIASAFNNITWDAKNAGTTIAGGISVAYPSRGKQVIDALVKSNGKATTCNDNQISKMQRILAQDEGIFLEPTSASAFVGIKNLISDGTIKTQDTILVPVTGFGLKDKVSFI